jgi:hypothetical protein
MGMTGYGNPGSANGQRRAPRKKNTARAYRNDGCESIPHSKFEGSGSGPTAVGDPNAPMPLQRCCGIRPRDIPQADPVGMGDFGFTQLLAGSQ